MSEFSVDSDAAYRRGKPYRDTAIAFRGLSDELSGIVRTHPAQPSPVHGEDCFVEGLDALVLLLQRIADKLDRAGLRASELTTPYFPDVSLQPPPAGSMSS